MKYETKAFSSYEYAKDVADGWIPVLRSDVGDINPRKITLTILPEFSRPSTRVCTTMNSTGEVYQQDAYGFFNPSRGEQCLDIVLRREVKKPAERTAHGIAYLTEKGVVTLVRSCEAPLAGLEDNPALTPVPCTITLHQNEPT